MSEHVFVAERGRKLCYFSRQEFLYNESALQRQRPDINRLFIEANGANTIATFFYVQPIFSTLTVNVHYRLQFSLLLLLLSLSLLLFWRKRTVTHSTALLLFCHVPFCGLVWFAFSARASALSLSLTHTHTHTHTHKHTLSFALSLCVSFSLSFFFPCLFSF